MIQSYEYKSKIANIIAFLAGLITYMGRDMLAQILPKELAYLAPFIVTLAGYILVQSTENTRVEKAEKIAIEDYEAQANGNPEDIKRASLYNSRNANPIKSDTQGLNGRGFMASLFSRKK